MNFQSKKKTRGVHSFFLICLGNWELDAYIPEEKYKFGGGMWRLINYYSQKGPSLCFAVQKGKTAQAH